MPRERESKEVGGDPKLLPLLLREMARIHKVKPLYSPSPLGRRLPSPLPSPGKEAAKKSPSVHRLAPLLLLTLYSIGSVLGLAPLPLIRLPPGSVGDRAERREESAESFKTHLPSNQINSLQAGKEKLVDPASLPCSALINGEAEGVSSISSSNGSILCCDRSHYRTDICYLRGDIRSDPESMSFQLYGARPGTKPETVRPYTRKFEEGVMSRVQEVALGAVAAPGAEAGEECEVGHGAVPGLVFSTGGYTGNVYHEFSDGLIPLYITAARFRGEVVLVVLEYHTWWGAKYRGVLQRLSNYKVVDLSSDRRVHCFSEVIVGLKIHGELTIEPGLMPHGEGIQDFQALLLRGVGHRRQLKLHQQPPSLPPSPSQIPPSPPCTFVNGTTAATAHLRPSRPKIAIFIRKQTRVLLNHRDVVRACKRIGFDVELLKPKMGTPLARIHDTLESADAMLAVHGAAVTHFLFMRPGAVLLQIVPLGLDWAADAFYGKPAQRLGLEYVEYKVTANESSLSDEYEPGSPVLVDPSVLTSKGWWEMKKVYMDKQNVRVDMKRFSGLLRKVYSQVMQVKCRTLIDNKRD